MDINSNAIAIIGLAGRFPGAPDVRTFARNLEGGVESIRFFTEQELLRDGASRDEIRDGAYVPARGMLDDVDAFDAAFFGISPREAQMMDPQHRVFLECAWHALENAGHRPRATEARVGVYAGAGMNTYLLFHLASQPALVERVGRFQTMLGNDKDFLATRVSYALDLEGPAVGIQTACSSSLVAVHAACQAILAEECDIALAGGVSIGLPQVGYLFVPGGILSPDGHCRAFDARAAGTVSGGGAAVVVLRRLSDALAAGDTIHAVILGSAVNNDGSQKLAFTAPSKSAQSQVIAEAQAIAHTPPDTIGYIEAHGTGTALGDPIEVEALTSAFRAGTSKRNVCGLGSVKTNVGHLDAAAGVAGLVKAVLSLKTKTLFPSLHYERPNPHIDLEASPFFVCTRTMPFAPIAGTRRAGVSSFGIGGTNAHVVLEEAPPPRERRRAPAARHVVCVSARTADALDRLSTAMADELEANADELCLEDVALTTAHGRAAFEHRRAVAAGSVVEAAASLRGASASRVGEKPCLASPSVVFLFPGQGAQRAGAAAALYATASTFRASLDAACKSLEAHLGHDLRPLLLAEGEGAIKAATARLDQTAYAQPALFATGYALAKELAERGVAPAAVAGHSVGEFAAACVAGIFDLDGAAAVVAARGRLMQQLPAGAMAAIMMPHEELTRVLPEGLAIAAMNERAQCVVSGPEATVLAFVESLVARGVACRRLRGSIAFHSPMIDPILAAFAQHVARVPRSVPTVPFLSTVTGNWLSDEEAVDPRYWVRQAREMVRFEGAMTTLLAEPRIVLELGPGATLTRLLRARSGSGASSVALAPGDGVARSDMLAALWNAGIPVDLADADESHEGAPNALRVPLPGYPFERERHWVDVAPVRGGAPDPDRSLPLEEWFWTPSFVREPPSGRERGATNAVMLVGEGGALARALERHLGQAGRRVVRVMPGAAFARRGVLTFTAKADAWEDYQSVLNVLADDGVRVDDVLPMHALAEAPPGSSPFDVVTPLLAVARALAGRPDASSRCVLTLLVDRVYDVTGDEELRPEGAAAIGAARVLPQECATIGLRVIDVDARTAREEGAAEWLGGAITREIGGADRGQIVALRGRHRWEQRYRPLALGAEVETRGPVRNGAVVLITGGLGSVGSLFADYLAKTARARLVLVSRGAEGESGAARGRALLEAGAEDVLLVSADVADAEAMAAVVAKVRARLGAIHGVVHTAGVAGERTLTPFERTGAPELELHFRAKGDGIACLDEALAGEPLDFAIATSSLASVLGGLGFSAYAAANAYLDAFAHARRRVPWCAVNWDGFHLEQPSSGAPAALSRLRRGIDATEGQRAFARVLSVARDRTQIVVSTGDLPARLARWVEFTERPLAPAAGALAKPGATARKVRVLPRNAFEEEVAAIWRDVLGVDTLSVDDDFFALGGHSLLATQVISRVRREFGVDLPFVDLFESPTVEAIALAVAELQLGRAAPDELERLMAEVEEMSDEQAREGLAEGRL